MNVTENLRNVGQQLRRIGASLNRLQAELEANHGVGDAAAMKTAEDLCALTASLVTTTIDLRLAMLGVNEGRALSGGQLGAGELAASAAKDHLVKHRELGDAPIDADGQPS